jgi:hypothetical protein
MQKSRTPKSSAWSILTKYKTLRQKLQLKANVDDTRHTSDVPDEQPLKYEQPLRDEVPSMNENKQVHHADVVDTGT